MNKIKLASINLLTSLKLYLLSIQALLNELCYESIDIAVFVYSGITLMMLGNFIVNQLDPIVNLTTSKCLVTAITKSFSFCLGGAKNTL